MIDGIGVRLVHYIILTKFPNPDSRGNLAILSDKRTDMHKYAQRLLKTLRRYKVYEAKKQNDVSLRAQK